MRPEPDPIANDARKERRARTLPPAAACALCGETQPETLKQVKVRRSWLEGHHAAVEGNDEWLLVVLCLTCHAKATALQRDVDVLDPTGPSSSLDKMANSMKSVGTFFELLAEACYRWAAQLLQVIGVLDVALPGWRTLPGMP